MLDEMINFIHSVPAVFEVIAQFVEDTSRPVLFVEDELPEVVTNWVTDWAGTKPLPMQRTDLPNFGNTSKRPICKKETQPV